MQKDRSLIFGILYYIVISLAIIIFGSPLFRVLGFEYAGLISLFASVHLLYYVVERTSSGKKGDILTTIQDVSPPVLLFSTIPLAISLLGTPIIPNCDIVYGIVMYVKIVYPTAFIATLFGIHYGWVSKTPAKRKINVAAFWLVTLLISFLPGYINPQIFVYGWQYGYFPGFVWDAAMSLKPAYWWSRGIMIFFGIHFLLDDIAFIRAGAQTRKERLKVKSKYWLLLLLVATLIESTLGVMGITVSHVIVEKKLKISRKVEGNIILHYADSTFTEDEEVLLKYNTSHYASEIRALYGITYNKPIDVYIYPSEEMYDRYIGTKSASITKPWLSEVHITKGNLVSLKHELVHAILSDHGNFPFDISWSTGLTEGSAVAVEEDYDGIRGCDEYAARILQLKLASGVREIMSFSGFASNASGKSYVFAGSFCKYLIRAYGDERFLQLYHSRDYDKLYGKSLSALEAEWVSSLHIFQTPMDHYDSLRVQFYFDRLSIVNEPCLRRIGRMTEDAEERYRLRKYAVADSIYELILQESDRLDAIRGRVYCQLQLHNMQAALAILDTSKAAATKHNSPALHLLRGDVIAMATGDLQKAQGEWAEALNMELSDRSFLAASARINCFAQAKEIGSVQEYLQNIYFSTTSDAFEKRIQLLSNLSSSDSAQNSFSDSRNYLLSAEYAAKGKLKESLYHLRKITLQGDNLFYTLIAKRVERLNAALVPITLQ